MNSHKICFITPGPHACSYHEEKKTRRGLVEVFEKTSNENKVAESDKSQRTGPILINVSIVNYVLPFVLNYVTVLFVLKFYAPHGRWR